MSGHEVSCSAHLPHSSHSWWILELTTFFFLGSSLAYCELYVTLAAVFAPGRFKFELFETDASDAEVGHDFFNACQRMDSKGIRVKVA